MDQLAWPVQQQSTKEKGRSWEVTSEVDLWSPYAYHGTALPHSHKCTHMCKCTHIHIHHVYTYIHTHMHADTTFRLKTDWIRISGHAGELNMRFWAPVWFSEPQRRQWFVPEYISYIFAGCPDKTQCPTLSSAFWMGCGKEPSAEKPAWNTALCCRLGLLDTEGHYPWSLAAVWTRQKGSCSRNTGPPYERHLPPSLLKTVQLSCSCSLW